MTVQWVLAGGPVAKELLSPVNRETALEVKKGRTGQGTIETVWESVSNSGRLPRGETSKARLEQGEAR